MDLTEGQNRSGWRRPSLPDEAAGARLAVFNAVKSRALPRYLTGHVIEPVRTIGTGSDTSLKVSFWHSTVEDSPQASDPAFVSVSLRTSPARAWRDASPSGLVSMLPFEGAHWRFEQPVSFMQTHLPFDLVARVSHGLFDRELAHSDLRMPADVTDPRLHGALRSIEDRASSMEPTNLLLDSWALILSEILLLHLSSHGAGRVRGPFGKLPDRGIARVVDYVEANLDQDLRLTSLAAVAGMSMFHFARRFRETVGLSPHAYVVSRRIVRARTMLRRSGVRLADVALACGFSSQAHFTTAFHRSLGVTPGRYARAMQ